MYPDKLEINEIKNQLVALTGGFCNTHVNSEYANICEALIMKMARKKSVPFVSGRVEIWAAAVVHAIGSINFLFDKKTKPYSTPDLIGEYFGTSKTTVTQKSKVIRDMFKMTYWDSEFSTQHMQKQNPYKNMAMLNGFLVMLDR
jgi:hypothetical protein